MLWAPVEREKNKRSVHANPSKSGREAERCRVAWLSRRLCCRDGRKMTAWLSRAAGGETRGKEEQEKEEEEEKGIRGREE